MLSSTTPRFQRGKVGEDILRAKKTFQIYKPSIASASARMFWVSIAITLSFVISQVYLVFTH